MCISSVYAQFPYMCISSVYAQFLYMRNFCIWNLYTSSFMLLHHICANSIYINCAYTKTMHIRKMCAYTETGHIRKICTYLPYMPSFRICVNFVYWICAYTMQIHELSCMGMSPVYARRSCIFLYVTEIAHIRKLCIYGNLEYTEDMRVSSIYP